MRLAVALHGGTSSSGAELATDALRTARAAREAGYSAVVAGQHFLTAPRAYLQPLPLLTRLIPETEGMRLVAGVLLLPLLHPVQLAEEIATVDALSGGRLVVGVGQGYREAEFAAFGVPRASRRDAQLRALAEMIAWWSGGDVRGAGAGLGMRPVSTPHPPIWFAASTPRAYARAVHCGYTPFVGPQVTTDALHALLSSEPRPAALAVRRDVLVTDVVGEEAVRRALSLRSGQNDEWGYGAATGLPHLVGTAEDCRRGIAELAAAGVTDLVIRTNWPGIDGDASREMLAAVAGPALATTA
jgi:alkanesulfonate monooxygenase SsuD/methylene tetrahydromethanopterin reductase-like flavin-dependent oxidoreductase (luciferase family)